MTKLRYRSGCEADTLLLGADLSIIMQPGDLLALSGDLGVGKSTLARGLIQHVVQDREHEVASPTYTLCNHYPAKLPVAHYDLYRLGSPEELEELGLDEALETGCALVEWPENGLPQSRENQVWVTIQEDGDNSREFVFSGDQRFLDRIARSLEIRSLLVTNGFPGIVRYPLDGDASSRRYEKLFNENRFDMLLMDSPAVPDGPPVKDGKPYSQIAHLAENASAFVAIDQHLREVGLAAPEIPVMDIESRILVVENLGSGKIIDDNRQPIEERYIASVEFLAHLHGLGFERTIKLPTGGLYEIPDYDSGAMTIEAELLLDWFIPEMTADFSVSETVGDEFREIWNTLIGVAHSGEQSLVLRDYHSPNIIWREEYQGLDRIGVIDFQDAVIGPSAYDVASIAQDARVDVSARLEERLCDHYVALRQSADPSFSKDSFKEQYAIMAALRTTKILGIFVRLNKRDGKPQYMAHLPRIREYLDRALTHPVLGDYKQWLGDVIEL